MYPSFVDRGAAGWDSSGHVARSQLGLAELRPLVGRTEKGARWWISTNAELKTHGEKVAPAQGEACSMS